MQGSQIAQGISGLLSEIQQLLRILMQNLAGVRQ